MRCGVAILVYVSMSDDGGDEEKELGAADDDLVGCRRREARKNVKMNYKSSHNNPCSSPSGPNSRVSRGPCHVPILHYFELILFAKIKHSLRQNQL